MTPEQIEFHRKRFEDKAIIRKMFCSPAFGERPFFLHKNGEYFFAHVEAAWQGYLMAIESIEIELPMPVFYRDEESPSERNHRYSYNSALNDTLHNIQSLGLKVKER